MIKLINKVMLAAAAMSVSFALMPLGSSTAQPPPSPKPDTPFYVICAINTDDGRFFYTQPLRVRYDQLVQAQQAAAAVMRAATGRAGAKDSSGHRPKRGVSKQTR